MNHAPVYDSQFEAIEADVRDEMERAAPNLLAELTLDGLYNTWVNDSEVNLGELFLGEMLAAIAKSAEAGELPADVHVAFERMRDYAIEGHAGLRLRQQRVKWAA